MPGYQKKQVHNHAAYIPAITYDKAKSSYFIHNNQVYSIADCSTNLFREAVLSFAPHWPFSDLYSPLIACPEDIVTRWFLLCGLCEAKQPMKLYESREEAVEAVKIAVAGPM